MPAQGCGRQLAGMDVSRKPVLSAVLRVDVGGYRTKLLAELDGVGDPELERLPL
jgi:hypothetical protein